MTKMKAVFYPLLLSCVLLWSFLFFLIPVCRGVAPPPRPINPLVSQVVETSVMVGSPTRWFGSGSTISLHGHRVILTAAHVVEDFLAREKAGRYREPLPARIASRQGKAVMEQRARIIYYDSDVDLALLLPERPACLSVANLAHKDMEVTIGEDVWYCGYGSGLRWNLDRSIVNQVEDDWTTVNGNVWYGHSGSGVHVRRGGRYLLVAVVSQAATPDVTPKTSAWCVSLGRIHAFLEAYRAAK